MQDMPATPPKSLFGLEGEQYWNKPLWQKSTMAFGSALVDKDVDGIFIDAPSKVHLDKHRTVPLAALRSGSTGKLHRFSLSTTTQLVMTHLETGRIQMIKPGTAPAEKDEEPPSPGWTVQDLEVDLAESLDLGPKLGQYSVWMVCGPEASNQRTITLFPSAEAEGAKETRDRLGLLRREGGPSLPLLGKTVDLILEPQKPADGKGPVWKLSQVQDGPGRHRLHLEYRIEGPPGFTYPKDKPHLDENGKRVHARIPMALVAFDENRSVALVKHLGLPVVAAPGGEADNPILSGHVSMSLEKLLGPDRKWKSLSLWAIALDQRDKVEISKAEKKAD